MIRHQLDIVLTRWAAVAFLGIAERFMARAYRNAERKSLA